MTGSIRSTVTRVQNWANLAASEFVIDSDEDRGQVTVDVGMFIGMAEGAAGFSSAIGIYLDIPGADPLPEQRVFGTSVVQPWGATEEFVTALVTDALTRMYRDRGEMAAEAKKRADDLAQA